MDITNRGKKEYPPRVLEYRKQVKIATIFGKYFSFFFLLSSFFFLTLLLVLPNIDEVTYMNYLWHSIIDGIYWLILYSLYLLLLKPMATSKIQVYKDKIFISREKFISRGKTEITIPFNEVKEIKSGVIKSLGGWFTVILNNKKKYRFAITLERVDYILDALIQFNPNLMKKKRYEKLRESLVLFDHGLARVEEQFKKKYRLITFSTLLLFLPLSLLVLLLDKQSNEFIIHSPLFVSFSFSDTLVYFFFNLSKNN